MVLVHSHFQKYFLNLPFDLFVKHTHLVSDSGETPLMFLLMNNAQVKFTPEQIMTVVAHSDVNVQDNDKNIALDFLLANNSKLNLSPEQIMSVVRKTHHAKSPKTIYTIFAENKHLNLNAEQITEVILNTDFIGLEYFEDEHNLLTALLKSNDILAHFTFKQLMSIIKEKLSHQVNIPDPKGITPLMHIIDKYSTELQEEDIVFFCQNSDVNYHAKYKKPAISYAINNNNKDLVWWLLKHGANVLATPISEKRVSQPLQFIIEHPWIEEYFMKQLLKTAQTETKGKIL